MSFQESPEADPARRVFVSYIDKSREYYLAQGFGNPYRWAYNADVPFAPLPKPLAECRIGVVTTSSPWEGQEDVDLPCGCLRSSVRLCFERLLQTKCEDRPRTRVS